MKRTLSEYLGEAQAAMESHYPDLDTKIMESEKHIIELVSDQMASYYSSEELSFIEENLSRMPLIELLYHMCIHRLHNYTPLTRLQPSYLRGSFQELQQYINCKSTNDAAKFDLIRWICYGEDITKRFSRNRATTTTANATATSPRSNQKRKKLIRCNRGRICRICEEDVDEKSVVLLKCALAKQ